MNDDSTGAAPADRPSSRRTIGVVAAVGVAGLVAGGLAAGALSSATAASDSTPAGSAYGAPRGAQHGDPSRPMRSDEKLLTGATRSKVLAAVRAKYPDAVVQRVETDSEGVYEAHVLDNAQPLTVQVGKDFTITGTQAGMGGMGGPGGNRGPGAPDDGGAQEGPPASPGSGSSSNEDSGFLQS